MSLSRKSSICQFCGQAGSDGLWVGLPTAFMDGEATLRGMGTIVIPKHTEANLEIEFIRVRLESGTTWDI